MLHLYTIRDIDENGDFVSSYLSYLIILQQKIPHQQQQLQQQIYCIHIKIIVILLQLSILCTTVHAELK